MESDGDAATSGTKGSSPTSEVAMPAGRYTGQWPNNPSEFANSSYATATFEPIIVDVSGNTWTIATSYSTSVPVGGGCFSVATHTFSGSGEIMVDAGGPELIGEVADDWERDRQGDGCEPYPLGGTQDASVVLTYADGVLDGWIEGHNITLTGE